MKRTIWFICAVFTAFVSCSSSGISPGPENKTPMLNSIVPNSGYEGQTAVVTAENLGEDAMFYFSDHSASYIREGENLYRVTIPAVKEIGRIEVCATTGGVQTNTLSFINKEVPDEPVSPEEYNVDGKGRYIHKKARPLQALKNVLGPFKKLADGTIMTVTGTHCLISSDGGENWVSYSLFTDTSLFGAESPVAAQSDDGTVVISFSNIKELSPLDWNNTTHCYAPTANLPLYVIYSTDNCHTWSTPLKLHDGWTGMIRDLLHTSDNKLIIGTNNMRNNYGRHCVITYTSSDNGRTWTASPTIDKADASGDHDGYMEDTIIELDNGNIWMLIRTNLDYFYESTSTDSGLSWSEPIKTDIDASSSPGALMRLESGRMLLVWNRLYHKGYHSIRRSGGDMNLSREAASWQRDELSIMYSDDDGTTWSDPQLIAWNMDPIGPTGDPWLWDKWLSYPHILEFEPGVIWINSAHGNLAIEILEKDL